jgi:hypothetical protein
MTENDVFKKHELKRGEDWVGVKHCKKRIDDLILRT